MKKIISFLSVLAITSFLLPSAFAVSWVGGENVLMKDAVSDDAYVVGGNANVQSEIFGDLYIAGGSVVINGTIHEDLVVAGGRVTVSGDVLGDVRVLGGQVAIYGNVGDDLVVGGGQVDVGNDAVISGSLISGAGILTVDGTVLEDLRGGVGVLILNGSIGRDVIVTVQDAINIAATASIGGNLKYSALIEAKIPGGVVKGSTSFNKFEKGTVLDDVTYVFYAQKLFGYLAILLLALILVIFVPRALTQSALTVRENILRSFGLGLLVTIGIFVSSILLVATIIGVPIAMILFALMLIVWYMAKLFAATWITSYFINFKKKVGPGKLFAGLAVSLLAYYLIGLIPYVGWLINFVLFLIGVGSVVLLKFEHFKFMRSKKML